jgi:hypothetical protein
LWQLNQDGGAIQNYLFFFGAGGGGGGDGLGADVATGAFFELAMATTEKFSLRWIGVFFPCNATCLSFLSLMAYS